MLKAKSRGFTLVEILVVVAIVALLLILGFWAFSKQLAKGRDARRKADINRIQVAVEEYEKDHNCYPPPNLVVCVPGTGLQPYLKQIPCDLRTGASYLYDYDTTTACARWYRVFAKLENTSDPDYTAGIGSDGTYSYVQSSPNAPAGNLFVSYYFGCKAGLCVPIFFDARRPGAECDPHYSSPNCSGVCSNPRFECKPWR